MNANGTPTGVDGIGVHIDARVRALAGPGEVLASTTVKDLAALARPRPPAARPLTAAWRAYGRELNLLLRTSRLAA